jgi:hypothetical protein
LERPVKECTQMAPSPTAEPTRLMLVERASPTQKMPGMPVSMT